MKPLDTSVAIDHLRGYAPATALLENLLQSEDPVVASELTRFEPGRSLRASDGGHPIQRTYCLWVYPHFK